MKAPVKILCHTSTTTCITKRWPMRFFFGMLDQAIVNARCLYTCKYADIVDDATKKKSAVVVLKEIVAHLIELYLIGKMKNTFMRTGIRKGVESILGINIPVLGAERVQLRKRARCALCPRQQDHKTTDVCPFLLFFYIFIFFDE